MEQCCRTPVLLRRLNNRWFRVGDEFRGYSPIGEAELEGRMGFGGRRMQVQSFRQKSGQAHVGEFPTCGPFAPEPAFPEELGKRVCQLHEQGIVRCAPVRFAERVLQPEAAGLRRRRHPPSACLGESPFSTWKTCPLAVV